jgi:hypothetical protein
MLVCLDELLQRLGAEQGDVGMQDQHVTREILEDLLRLPQRVPRP